MLFLFPARIPRRNIDFSLKPVRKPSAINEEKVTSFRSWKYTNHTTNRMIDIHILITPKIYVKNSYSESEEVESYVLLVLMETLIFFLPVEKGSAIRMCML